MSREVKLVADSIIEDIGELTDIDSLRDKIEERIAQFEAETIQMTRFVLIEAVKAATV